MPQELRRQRDSSLPTPSSLPGDKALRDARGKKGSSLDSSGLLAHPALGAGSAWTAASTILPDQLLQNQSTSSPFLQPLFFPFKHKPLVRRHAPPSSQGPLCSRSPAAFLSASRTAGSPRRSRAPGLGAR